LENLWNAGYFLANPDYRLAFREFGTIIGVQVNKIAPEVWRERAENLNKFWEPSHFLNARDKDITPIMFCTCLIPGVMDKNYKRMRSAFA